LLGNAIILLGIIVGIITTWIYSQWWILIILVGSLIVQGLGFLGACQKYKIIKNIETITKEVDHDDKI